MPELAIDITNELAEHPLTRSLPAEARDELAASARLMTAGPGEVVVSQGDEGDAAYLILSGRLDVEVDGLPAGSVGRGETIGEMALMTGETRTATVRARRPSTLVRIDAAHFSQVLANHPETYRVLTAQLVDRLSRVMAGSRRATAAVLAIEATDPDLRFELVSQLRDAIERTDRTVAVASPDWRSELAGLEADHDVVLIPTETRQNAEVSHFADRTVQVAEATRGPQSTPAADPPTDLAIVHPTATDVPEQTRRLLDAIRPNHHHHLRLGIQTDLDRLARRLLGCETVLVLGGGGARGLAHLGTYRALVEAGIGIDALVGVSAGGLMAAPIALGWEPPVAEEQSVAHLIDAGSLLDLTVPVVALSSGRRITERIQEIFGATTDLEDCWLPLTTISADLTTLTTRVHSSGPVWRAIRATVAVPGVFPPLKEGDAVLVDGGIVDNLPVSLARELYPNATIISSDVGKRTEFLADGLPDDGVVSGLQSAWFRATRRGRVPNVAKLLYRLTSLGSAASDEIGDVHIEHELDEIGMFDFASARPAIEYGYERTVAVLERDASLLDLSAAAGRSR